MQNVQITKRQRRAASESEPHDNNRIEAKWRNIWNSNGCTIWQTLWQMIHCTEKYEIPGCDKKPDNKTLIGFSTYSISLHLYETLELQKGRGEQLQISSHTTTTTLIDWSQIKQQQQQQNFIGIWRHFGKRFVELTSMRSLAVTKKNCDNKTSTRFSTNNV